MSWGYQEEQAGGGYVLKDAPREPECGEDFCDRCGDCLECNGSDPCWQNGDGPHLWVAYLEDAEDGQARRD